MGPLGMTTTSVSPTYKKTRLTGYLQSNESDCPDKSYWERFKVVKTFQATGPCVAVSFAPDDLDKIFFSASVRVSLRYGLGYDGQKSIFKHSDNIQSMCVRHDGKLTAVGTSSGEVLIIDNATKNVLRTLTGHKASVKSVQFFTNKTHLVSTSDDCTVRLWDITTGQDLWVSSAMKDFIRCCAVSRNELLGDVFAVGSYDHSVSVWKRTEVEGHSPVVLNHGSPVEAVAIFPDGRHIASAGLNSVKIWDLGADGKLLKEILVHHKTITHLHIHHEGRYLFTSSLDQSLKVIDLSNYSLVHQFRFVSPILNFSVSNDTSRVCVGLSNGSLIVCGLSISQRKSAPKKREPSILKAMEATTIERESSMRLNKLDRLFKSFRYREALDIAMQSKDCQVLTATLRELLRRNGLTVSLSGRTEVDIAKLIQTISRNLSYPQHASILLEAAFVIFDIYINAQGVSPSFDLSIKVLRRAINQYLKIQEGLMELNGCISFLEGSCQADSL